MLSKPLAYVSALDRDCLRLRKPACRVLRGGVLEPGAHAAPEMRRQKPPLLWQRHLPLRSGRGPFSLRRGLKCLPCLLQL